MVRKKLILLKVETFNGNITNGSRRSGYLCRISLIRSSTVPEESERSIDARVRDIWIFLFFPGHRGTITRSRATSTVPPQRHIAFARLPLAGRVSERKKPNAAGARENGISYFTVGRCRKQHRSRTGQCS